MEITEWFIAEHQEIAHVKYLDILILNSVAFCLATGAVLKPTQLILALQNSKSDLLHK